MGIGDELATLIEAGPSQSRFPTQFASLLREIRADWGRTPEQIRDEVSDADGDHAFLNYIVGLSRWEQNGEYEDGAQLALEAVTESIEFANREEWVTIEKIVLEERIKLLNQLNHTEPLPVAIEDAIQFLLDHPENLPISQITDLLDVTIPSLHVIDDSDIIQSLQTYLDSEATNAIDDNRYKDSRALLRAKIKIHNALDVGDSEPVQNAIIQTYSAEIEFHSGTDRHFHRADAAHEGIVECIEWIDEEQRVQWEREYLQANQESIEQMAEISYEPSEEDFNELTEGIEGIIEQFKELKQERHAVFAIKWLINHDIFLPSISQARDIAEGGISNIIPTQTITREGGSYAQGDSGGEWPNAYGTMVQMTQNIRQSVYYRLQNRGLVSELDFYVLFNLVEEMSGHTLAYITDFIINIFEHRHPEAVHLGMTQLEALIRELMADHGKSTQQLDSESGELRPRGLSGLLYQIQDELDEDWLTYMQYWYADLSGQNIRNQIAHGHFPYQKANWGMSVILLFDMLHTLLAFEQAFE